MIDINDAWYRISAKAIIYNDKWQILLCKESSGIWDIPGGWLNHGEDPRDCIKRELVEEMWLQITSISSTPICFITAHKESSKSRPWISNICYKVEVNNLNFSASDECVEIGFFDDINITNITTIVNVAEVFKALFK